MVKARVISDILAKRKCQEWLETVGFTDTKPAKRQSCDLLATKGGIVYYIEIKYSSKEAGSFFGTVMLTELYKAICNEENYLFLVCRGKDDNIDNWFFKLFGVKDFLKCCTLTTPIFLYHLDVKDGFNLTPPTFTKNTKLATEELIGQIWKDFNKWKIKQYPSSPMD